MKKLKERYKPINLKMYHGVKEMPHYTLSINGLPMNSLPTSDRISGSCTKRSAPKVELPAGKTIGIGYNKGTYQVVDSSDFKTMGRKV